MQCIKLGSWYYTNASYPWSVNPENAIRFANPKNDKINLAQQIVDHWIKYSTVLGGIKCNESYVEEIHEWIKNHDR